MPKGKTVTIKGRGNQKPLKFKKGGLHRQLGVPQGEPIPPGKKKAALAGKFGKLAKKRANFAFKGALAAGRKTAEGHMSAGMPKQHRRMSRTEMMVSAALTGKNKKKRKGKK